MEQAFYYEAKVIVDALNEAIDKIQKGVQNQDFLPVKNKTLALLRTRINSLRVAQMGLTPIDFEAIDNQSNAAEYVSKPLTKILGKEIGSTSKITSEQIESTDASAEEK